MNASSQESAKCPLCGATGIPIDPAPSHGGPYSHCECCDLIFAEAGALPTAEEEYVRYLEHNNSHDSPGYVAMFEEFLDVAVWPFIRQGRVLDFGCGPGPVLKDLLRARGFDAVTYDPLFADHKDRLLWQCYDLITTTEVLEHVHDLGGTLQQLFNSLKGNGLLAIMTHLHPGAEEFSSWWYHRDPTHVAFLSSRTLRWIERRWSVQLVYCDCKKTFTFRKLKERASSG